MAGPDAYVPGHSHDLFVSYAWVDNQIPGTDRPEDAFRTATG